MASDHQEDFAQAAWALAVVDLTLHRLESTMSVARIRPPADHPHRTLHMAIGRASDRQLIGLGIDPKNLATVDVALIENVRVDFERAMDAASNLIEAALDNNEDWAFEVRELAVGPIVSDKASPDLYAGVGYGSLAVLGEHFNVFPRRPDLAPDQAVSL